MTAKRPLCPGHTKAGKPCGRVAGYGTSHLGYGLCKFHGGASPGGIKQGHRLAAEAAVVTFGLPVDINPHEALLEEISRTAGHVHWLGNRIAELEPNALVIGLKSIKVETGDKSGKTTETAASINVWLELYHRERRHLVEVCRVALAAGVEERMVQLAENDGRRIVAVLLSGFDALLALLEGDVGADRLAELRREQLPDIVRKAIETTASEDR